MVIERPYVRWCSVQLNVGNAPYKHLSENDNSRLSAPPEDRTDGETSFSRSVRGGQNGTFCTTRTHLAVSLSAYQ